MKPLELKIKGFLSYKEETRIDFSELGLFAITGPTGAGKTSIVDAIVYALYGQTPRFGKKETKNLISKNSDRLYVEFSFYINDTQYTIQRTESRTKGQEVTILRQGKKIYDKDKNKDVNEEILNIIKIDYNTFTRIILLPQGEFAKFVKPDSPSERRDIIMKLTGFDKIKNIKDKAYKKLNDIKSQIDAIEHNLENLKIKDNLEELKEQLSNVENDLKLLQDEKQIWQQREKEAIKKEELINYIQRRQKELDDLKLNENKMKLLKSKIDNLSKYINLKSDLERFAYLSDQVKKLQEDLSNKQNEYTILKKRYEGFLNDFHIKAQEYNKIPQEKDRINKGQNMLDYIKLAIPLEKEISNIKSKLESKNIEISNYIDKLNKTEQHLKSLEDILNSINIEEIINKENETRKELGVLENIEKEFRQKKSDYEKLQKDVENQKRLLSMKEKNLSALKEEFSRLKDEIILQYSSIIKSILKDNDICPVCGGIYHKKSSIEHITGNYDKLLEDIKNLEDEILKLSSDIKLKEDRLSDLEKDIKEYSIRLSSKKELEESLEKILKIYKEYENNKSFQEKLLNEKSILKNNIKNVKQNIKELEAQLEEKSRNLKDIEDKLRELGLSDVYIKNKEQAKLKIEEKIQEITKTISNIESDYIKAKEDKNQYEKSIELLEKDIDNIKKNIENINKELSILSERLKSIEDKEHTLEELEKIEDYKKQYDDYILNLKSLIQDIEQKQVELDKISEKETLDNIKSQILQISQKIDFLNQQKGKLSEKIEKIQESQRQIKELSDTKEELERQHMIYDRIYNDLKSDALQKYISQKILENIAYYANEYAQKMQFPYIFVLEDKDDKDDILVQDAFGNKRPIKSLSGGETFISSICFALTLSEAIGISNIEAIFIDEGFGTLDKETLEKVGDALEVLSQNTKKTIGIITHVQELAEKCKSVIRVEKTKDGSRIIEVSE